MDDDLKPCPWCGSAEISTDNDGEVEWLRCDNCHATGPFSADDAAADLSIEAAWNKRPVEDALRERVKVLEGALGPFAKAYDPDARENHLGDAMVFNQSTLRTARAALKDAEA